MSLSISTASTLRTAIVAQAGQVPRPCSILIDLTGVDEIDAAGISHLGTGNRMCAETGVVLAVHGHSTIRQPAQVRRHIVDQLPHVSLNVLDLPGELQRELFDAFQLEIRYDRHRQQVTIKAAVRAEMIDSIGQAATGIAGQATVPRQQRSTESDATDRAGAPAPARKSVPMFDVPPAPHRPAHRAGGTALALVSVLLLRGYGRFARWVRAAFPLVTVGVTPA